MPRPELRRLVVNADDFGDSASINAAVMKTHREGILTTASLMVGGGAWEEAVEQARRMPGLGVGLHLTFLFGRPVLAPEAVPGLVDARGEFSRDPVRSGMRFFFDRSLGPQLAREMDAQFERFRATGLELDHVNGHLNLHLHPVLFRLLLDRLQRWGIRRVRLTRDPLGLNLALARGNLFYRVSHAMIFQWLSYRALGALRGCGVAVTDRVFGLLQNARVTEDYVLGLLERLPSGSSELYAHPSMDAFQHETLALCSAEVRCRVEKLGIRLARYQDLEP